MCTEPEVQKLIEKKREAKRKFKEEEQKEIKKQASISQINTQILDQNS